MSVPSRQPTQLSLDEALVREARDMRIDLSLAAEAGIVRAVATERGRRWAEENAEIVRSSNEYLAKHGMPLQKYRAR